MCIINFLLAPRAGRRSARSIPEFRARSVPAFRGPRLSGVNRRNGRAPFATRTFAAPTVLPCRPTL